MLPTYPNMTLNSAPYSYQSTRPDPSNTSTCKPVAIISHDSELTLITCSQTTRTQDNKFICQHQKLQSDASQIPVATLIQDLQKRSCCVYTASQDGTSLQEQVVEHEANDSPLAELKPEDFAGLMETNNEHVNQSTPADLGLHKVDEEAMQRLLPPAALSSGLNFSQQGASTSSASLNQGASTSGQTPSLVALLSKTSSKIELTQQQKKNLDSLIPSQKRIIYCLLDILENTNRPFIKTELINLIKEKYTNFDNIQSIGSCFNHAFAYAVSLDLIQKSARHAGINTLTYTRKIYSPAALEYLKQEVAPTLILRLPEAAHSNDGQ